MRPREVRNAALVVVLVAFVILGFWALEWGGESRMIYLGVSVAGILTTGAILVWSLFFQDKLPDTLAELTGGLYYERDGLCFMPVVRKKGNQAYICIFYENRFGNDCNVIVHLRPPPDSIQHRPDARDIHFAFTVPGGAVGVIRQPIAVHPRLQGQVVKVQMAAAVNYPLNKGDKLRSHTGMPCGTFHVDWGENFRIGLHELSGELELIQPVSLNLPIPMEVTNRIRRGQQWEQQLLSAAR